MPSDAFIGILTGLGNANRERQKNLFDTEMERREKLAQQWEKLAENPNLIPEAAEEYYRRAFSIRTTEPNKKLPKELMNLDLSVEPKPGQSWLDGQTSRDTTPQPMPIASDLEGGLSLGNIQGGKGPANGEKVQAMRTPEAHPQQAPMPTPPPGTTRSPFYSPREQAQMKMQQAVEMLKAEFGMRLPFEVELAKQKKALEPEEFFPFGLEQGIAERGTGKVVREPQAQPDEQSVPQFRDKEVNGRTIRQYFRRDPSQVIYEEDLGPVRQPQPPATIRIGESMDVDTWTNLVSTGQVELNDVPNAIARDRVAQEMAKRGLLNVPKEIREAIATNIEPAKNMIAQIEDLAQKIMDGENRAMNTILLERQTAGIGTLLGRMIGGERGVITDRDRDVAVNLLPGWVGTNFAPSFVKAQMDYIKNRIAEQEKAYRQGYFQTMPAPGGGGGGGGSQAPEGTIITNDRGERMVKRNGQWVPQ